MITKFKIRDFIKIFKKNNSHVEVNVINKSKHPLPNYETLYAAGLDIKANIDTPIVLNPGEITLISTGLFIELPIGYEVQIRPRSGLAIKHGISVLNSPGTIDSDYRGEIKIILINFSKIPFIIKDGERICQMILAQYIQLRWNETKKLNRSIRGSGGFGHTGS